MRSSRLFALLIFVASSVSSAIDPKYELEAQRKAPEVLKVRVGETILVRQQRVSCADRFKSRSAEGSQVRSEFTGRLTVLETLRDRPSDDHGQTLIA